MKGFTTDVFQAFQNKLKVGNRRGVHLNAIPGNSRYKFDLARLATVFESLPERFILDLLTQKNMNFKFSVHDKTTSETENSFQNHPILDENKQENLKEEVNSSFTEKTEKEQLLQKLAMSFDNLIFQNEVIQSEKGINTLGFGFPILIRKDVNDGQITAAPILIWSLKIKQTSEMNTWEITRNEDDPIYLNEVLMNHLQSDSEILLKPIPIEMLDDGKIDKPELHAICTEILMQLKVDQNIDFLLNNYEKIPPLKTKANYDKQLQNRGDALIEKSGIFSLFEVQKQNIINDYENLKTAFVNNDFEGNANFQSITAVETDPSQQNILESLKQQSKILIQGPPGTGKSQTLTAILINALQNKQKTIVVCEKQTALEVLYNALEKYGLGKYCILIKDSVLDRKLVVDSVRNTIDHTNFKKKIDFYPESILSNQIKNLEEDKSQINTIHQTLNQHLIEGLDFSEIVYKILNYKSLQNKIDINKLIFEFTNDEFLQLKHILDNGENIYLKFKPYRENYLYTDNIIKENPFVTQQKINESFAEYQKEWNEIETLLNDYEGFYYNKRKEEFTSQLEKANQLINETEVITATLSENADEFNTEKTKSIFYKLFSLFSSAKKKTLKNQKRLLEISEQLKALSLHENFLPLAISSNLWQTKNEIIQYRTKTHQISNAFVSKIENDFKNIDVLNLFDKNVSNTVSDKINSKVSYLKSKIKDASLIQNTHFGTSFTDFKIALENIFKQYNAYNNNLENPFLLGYQWFAFYNSLNTFQKKCVTVLYDIQNWEASFLYEYFNLLLNHKASNNLNFNEKTYTDFRKNMLVFTPSQKNFIENYWDVSQQNAVKDFEHKNKDITVANLYNKRKSTNHNRLPLRQIALKDVDLFTTFFPIILTTPDVCSNLFQGKNYYFDYVVFDEASQLKLEDNLPAVLKGKNVIIAGDEHQMPPSNYFSRVFDGSIEDEDDVEDEEIITFKNAILNIESLLDFALEYQFDKNHLDFHYRSKHPYLIDFSNHAFYNSRLKPLPSFDKNRPIEFFEVDGIFHEHINKEEAQKVIEILENIQPKSNGTYPSVGIATFNITQRNYIRRKILEKQNTEGNDVFKQKIIDLENAGLFIKNLENIQGDERDIIIISTTYGKKKDGKFLQSFGPINHTKGYKLLNVIITRAKEKIYICNSIPSVFYSNYKEALAQEGANNRRAVFYTYLAYCKAVSDENNQRRLEVLNDLDTYGYKEKVDTNYIKNNFKEQVYTYLKEKLPTIDCSLNYDFGGYPIDILLKPQNKKPIAIECMSKPLYKGNLGYLEDLHKEKILQNAGFEYIRIWSYSCWQNRELEIEKLKKYI